MVPGDESEIGPSGIVAVYSLGGNFCGTAFLVSPRFALTCAHVMEQAREHFLGADGDGNAECDAVGRSTIVVELRVESDSEPVRAVLLDGSDDKEFDFAILHLSREYPGRPLTLVDGVHPDWLQTWSGGLEARGFAHDGRRGAVSGLSIKGALFADGPTVLHSQTEGGVPPGMSGSPLLVKAGDTHFIVGMYVASGVVSARSLFLGADALIRVLREHRIEPSVVPSGQVGSGPSPRGFPSRAPAALRSVAHGAYTGMHEFVGRTGQLASLDEWASSPSKPVLCIEAMGGMGKSSLAWEWTQRQNSRAAERFAETFWYSFYLEGASIAHFCKCALAFIHQRPPSDFKGLTKYEARDDLLSCLQDPNLRRLIVLDGIERLLVAYANFNASSSSPYSLEEAANDCDLARPIDRFDLDFLGQLPTLSSVKFLATTRLMPFVWRGDGVVRMMLPGLEPSDAERMLRNCGITGTTRLIRSYLQSHVDCHPLVTGIIAGLVEHHAPAPRDFDAWALDPRSGGRLNISGLDLRAKRHHILSAAVHALSEQSRRLLEILSLLSTYSDAEMLSAMVRLDAQGDPELSEHGVDAAIRDLRMRGLVLERTSAPITYDLHPIVRGFVASTVSEAALKAHGDSLIPFLSAKLPGPFKGTQSLEALRYPIQLVRIATKTRPQRHALAILGNGALIRSLIVNLEQDLEALSLLSPFFPGGWNHPIAWRDGKSALLHLAGLALRNMGRADDAWAALSTALRSAVEGLATEAGVQARERAKVASACLMDLAQCVERRELAFRLGCLRRALAFADVSSDPAQRFACHLSLCRSLSDMGRPDAAAAEWRLAAALKYQQRGDEYRPGTAEECEATLAFRQDTLSEEQLSFWLRVGRDGCNRQAVRALLVLQGKWHFKCGRLELALKSFEEAARMARQVLTPDYVAETLQALTQCRLDLLSDPRQSAGSLERVPSPFHLGLAELWLIVGDSKRAEYHALEAFSEACADGTPYVYQDDLTRSAAILNQLGQPVPRVPVHDRATVRRPDWQPVVDVALGGLHRHVPNGLENSEIPN